MGNLMPDERARLEQEHRETETAFELAQATLRTKIGVSQKSEYDRLSRAVDEAWNSLQRARERLDRHIREQERPSAISTATND
jgi:hypothetical protein